MRTLRAFLTIVFLLIVVAVVGGGWIFWDITRGPLPEYSGEVAVEGLAARVDVVRDAGGVPHIYAENPYDLFFAQGYVHAQDRWWQMEFSRHTGSGSLGGLVGANDEIRGIDVFIRTAGWRRSAERDYERLGPEEREIVQAFADGVNAYIGGKPPTDLAMEYGVLGLTGVNFDIEPWTPVDSIVWGKVMSWDLASNRSRELEIAALAQNERISDEMIPDIYPAFPFGERDTVLLAEEIPLLAQNEASTSTARTQFNLNASVGEVRLAGGVPADLDVAFGHGLSLGSNNWVVSGDLTETGMPMMANDMHLSVGIPSIWYEVGLHCQPVSDACPYNVVGFALPATPLVISGHNERIGWALTNVGPDTQDMYLIRVNPENPLEYEWNGEMRSMTTHEEQVRFGDGTPPLTLTVRETHLGPIMNDNTINDDGSLSGFNNENPLAMRWTATAEPSELFIGLRELNVAGDWDEFRTALAKWDSPSQNIIYADVDGNIGYQMPGLIPVRVASHDGFTPVPGWTDEFEWVDYVPYDLLPRAYNPERGFIGSANQPSAPLEYYDALGDALGEDVNGFFQTQTAFSYRGTIINELIPTLAPHSFETFQQMQLDTYSMSAAEITPYLLDLSFEGERLNEYVGWLGDWDYRYEGDSGQAFLYGHIWTALLQNIYGDQLPDPSDIAGNERFQWATYQLMGEPDNVWWDDIGTIPIETRDDILRESFVQGVGSAERDGGEDRSTWRWDAVHEIYVAHNPLGVSGVGLIENMVNRGPFAVAGTDGALNNMRWNVRDGSFDTDGSIVSMRSIVDFSDFDNSVSIIPTGQSGHPFSPHYDDKLPLWASGEYLPLHWTREAVEAGEHTTLTLLPGQ